MTEEPLHDLLGLPAATRVQLAHAPLVLTVCQLQFSAALSVSDPSVLASFQRDIQAEYPVARPTSQVQLQVGLGPGEPGIKQQSIQQGYSFADQRDVWVAVLTTESLSLETRMYHHFPDFEGRFRRLLIALTRHVHPSLGTRLGLRYINEVRGVEAPWHDVIRPGMLGALGTPEFATAVVQTVQETALRYPQNRGITIRNGLLPRGTTVRPRKPEETFDVPFYLLDFDAFSEYPADNPLAMDPDLVCDRIFDYHESIYRLFRWSVTDAYLDTVREDQHAAS